MLLNFGIGFVLFFVIKKLGWKFFRSNAQFFYWSFIGVLIITYIIGLEVKGSKRWIDLLFFGFKGVNFSKFFYSFFADFFSKTNRQVNIFINLTISLFYFLLPTFIIFKQPDLGNAMVYVFIYFVMVLFSSIPKKKCSISHGGGFIPSSLWMDFFERISETTHIQFYSAAPGHSAKCI